MLLGDVPATDPEVGLHRRKGAPMSRGTAGNLGAVDHHSSGAGRARLDHRRGAVSRLSDLRRLLTEESADPEVLEQARRRKEAALLDFGVGQSAVASWLYAKCHHHIPTTAIRTAAVVATGDGSCALLYNPYFFLDLDFDGVKFVLFHEARHLIFVFTTGGGTRVSAGLPSFPTFGPVESYGDSRTGLGCC
jgi:hypothetical protein